MRAASLLPLLCLASLSRRAAGAAFTPGSVCVVRVGPAPGGDMDAAAPVFLREVSPASGAVLQELGPLPVTQPLRGSEDYTLSLTGDGSALLLGGFLAAAGTADVRCTGGAAAARGVVAVRGDGSFAVVASSKTDFDGNGGSVAGGCAVGEIRCAMAVTAAASDVWVVGEDSTIQQEGVMYAGSRAGAAYAASGPWAPVSPDPDRVLRACALRDNALWFGGGVGNGGEARYVQVLAPVGLPTGPAPRVTVSRDAELAEITGLAFSGVAGATLWVADEGAPASPLYPSGMPCGVASYSLFASGWEYFVGYLADGEDIYITDSLTYLQAQAWCVAQPFCIGFTFKSNVPTPGTPQHTYFKTQTWSLTPQNYTLCAADSSCWMSWRKQRDNAPIFRQSVAPGASSAPCMSSLTATAGTGLGADATLYGASLDGSALLSWSAAAGTRTLSSAPANMRYTGVALSPMPPAAGAPAAASGGAVAAAILGTLAGLGLAAAGVAFFLPTWGFTVGRSHVVPADYIRAAAAGVAGAVSRVGSAITGLGRPSGAAAASAASYSAVSRSPPAAYGAM